MVIDSEQGMNYEDMSLFEHVARLVFWWIVLIVWTFTLVGMGYGFMLAVVWAT